MKLVHTMTAAAAALALSTAPTAAADPGTAGFGIAQQLADAKSVVMYTIDDLRRSADSMNLPLAGQLYESGATVIAVRGTTIPAFAYFTARGEDGRDYRALFAVGASQSLSGRPLAQGEQSTGKLYFDVTGSAPTRVVYNDTVQDRLVWQQ